MSVKLLLKANANFGNFCFNHDLNKETIIYNCTGNKDKIFIDNNSFHSRNRLSNVPDTQSFVVRACFPSGVHVADRGGKSFLTSHAIYRVYQYSVYICQGSEREDFLPIMSKITHFFAPTSSDGGKRSNASSTSNKNNKDEDDEPPPKRSLKSSSTSSCEATGARCASSKKSSVSSEDVEGIINDLFKEDQKKVLHHYHRCRERNCSGLRTDEKQRLSSKKDKFQHKWLFEANVFCEKTGLTWLVFIEGEGMYCLICKKHKLTNQQNKSDIFNEKPSIRYKTTAINEHAQSETFVGNIMQND